LIYPKIDAERAIAFVACVKQVGQQKGMRIHEPTHVSMEDDSNENYANTLRQNLNEQVQLVSIVVKSRRIDRYNLIKRICCVEIPTPSEVGIERTSFL
jgi:aubergine